MVDLIGFKGCLKQHVTFMTANFQTLAKLTYKLVKRYDETSTLRTSDTNKANRLHHLDTKMSIIHHQSRTVASIWFCYIVGAGLGCKASNNSWWDGDHYTLFLPAVLIAVTVWINDGPSAVQPPQPPQAPLFDLLHQHNNGCEDAVCTVTIEDLRALYEKAGKTLHPKVEQTFMQSDIHDTGVLSQEQFVNWISSKYSPSNSQRLQKTKERDGIWTSQDLDLS